MMLEEFVPFEVLQSQLFILKILSACMTSHWKYYRTMKRERELEQQLQSNDDTSSISTLVNQNQQNQNQQNQNYQNQNYQNQQGQSSQSNHSKQFKLPRSWDDPPPLEDSLAKYILSVLSRFLHQMASQEDNATGQPPNGNPAGPGSPNNFPATAQGSSATFEIINDIYRNAGRVIFYISASNWNVVFSRIRNRIGYLTSTNDEWPETSELKLLECSDLNSKRLSMVLQGFITILFINFQRF